MKEETKLNLKFIGAYLGFIFILLLCAAGESIIDYLLKLIFNL